jgi:tetratricopeptide (TPR) repeat protein
MADPRARLERATALATTGNLDEALKLCAGAGAGPDEAGLRRLEGQILQAQGRDAEAASAYERIVAGDPGDWEIWNNLGNARRAIGDAEGAVAALRRAASIRPGVPPIQANLGSALAQAGRLEAALEAYREALDLGPEIALEAARLLRLLGRLDEAFLLLDRVPDSALAQVERARTLTGLHRLDEAERAYRAALRGQPGFAEAWLELGIVLERAGRIAELPPLLAEAAEKGVPPDALAYLQALRLQRQGKTDEALALARLAPAEVEPVRTQRLISRLADKAGDAALAFEAASRANRLAAAEHPEAADRAAGYRAHVEALAAVVTPAWYRRWQAPGGSPGPLAPAFLVGFPRSGTTLLDTMLMGHERTHVLEEIPLLERVMREVGELSRVAELGPAEIERLRQIYFAALDEASPPPPGALVIDKLPLNILGAPLIHRLFPDARFILALRHPCDVVLSCFMQGFELNDAMANFLSLDDAARLYDRVLGFWRRCRQVLPLRVFELRYEDLVAEPEAAIRPLIHFLGLDWDERVLDHQRTAAERGVISTPSYNQVTQRLYGEASGRWRRYREQLAPALPILEPWAERLGYSN